MQDPFDVIILTCKRDERLARLASAGLRKFWPNANPRVFMDTDRSTESDLPDDVRDVVRRVPYLRRVFDFPLLANTETICIMDSDCLTYSEPAEFTERAFQGNPGGNDRMEGLALWREMGVKFDCHNVRFVGGMFTAGREMWIEGRDTAIEWVRRCVAKGHDRVRYPGVTCEQSLVSGLWRQRYPHNPLPPERYPYGRFIDGCAIWHTSSFLEPWALERIDQYEAMARDW